VIQSKLNKVYLDEKFIWHIVIQILKGLQVMHGLNIMHRDLKSSNILLFKDGTAKLGDLNLSKIAKDGFLKT
jgi:NIMA (never in mitosis gene a)-related kinase